MLRSSQIPLFAAALGATIPVAPIHADTTPQSLPFTQAWSNTTLIAVSDDWSGVPGVIGHRGDAITGGQGVDPQTLLADGTNTPVDVNANQIDPDVFNTGGVIEFELPNPTIALNGSGTADAPFILVTLDTTGASNVRFGFIARDLDGTADDAIQQIAVHYRVGNTGLFTNLPDGFVADATMPGAAGLATEVIVQLPVAAENQPLVQVRVMTANALGNDESVGIDNIFASTVVLDSDNDGVIDFFDNCPGANNPGQEDCDDNGIGDACDAPCPSDTDGDGIPDKLDNCPAIANPGQEDCNGNDVGDVCDIANGVSQDCNLNGIPDECLAFEPDCNLNGMPDDCDIANGTSLDVNPANGIPDECENPIQVLINEVLADPSTTELLGDANNDGVSNSSQDEFVEIVNNSGASVDMSGWSVNDAVQMRHFFPPGTVVANNCSIVVFGGGVPTGQFGGGVVQVASSLSLGLNNQDETVELRDVFGLLVSRIAYGSEGNNDASLTRNPDIVGPLPLVRHDLVAPAGARFSPGRQLTGALFGGCTTLPDQDQDGIPDVDDNCPAIANASQADCDDDGIGDVCDSDPDTNGNGVPDVCEVGPQPGLRLNEIRIDETGSDNNEYVELKGAPGTSLNNMSLVVIGESPTTPGAIEMALPLTGLTIPADGHLVIAETTFSLVPPAQVDHFVGFDGLNFENSDNLTFVLVGNFTGFVNQDLDTDDDGDLELTPWLSVIDAVGLIEEPNPPQNTRFSYAVLLGGVDVGPDVTFVPGQVYRCEPAGLWQIGRFNPFDPLGGTDTPGALNLACPANCPPDIAPPGGNGTVNVDDLLAVINGWGACTDPNNCPADIAPPGGNDLVNVDDLLAVINGWGPCQP